MADEDWYKPHRSPMLPRQPTPGERVWSLRKNGRQVDCEIRFHGESYGWECQCLHDGELAYGRRFPLRELALEEAEAQRQRLQKAGWTPLSRATQPRTSPISDDYSVGTRTGSSPSPKRVSDEVAPR